jgi:hypothetical protein
LLRVHNTLLSNRYLTTQEEQKTTDDDDIIMVIAYFTPATGFIGGALIDEWLDTATKPKVPSVDVEDAV